MNICISGLTASGKTTHSHLVAGEFGMGYVSASQILLSIAGLTPVQTRDFWLSPSALALWNDEMTMKVDAELRRLSQTVTHYVFDAFALPWRALTPCLKIYLHSDLQSRIRKAQVSHRGEGPLSLGMYAAQIQRKDEALLHSHSRLFGLDADNLDAFHLVLDISSAIAEPTYSASLSSIALVQECVRSAVAYALHQTPETQRVYAQTRRRNEHLFLSDSVLDVRVGPKAMLLRS